MAKTDKLTTREYLSLLENLHEQPKPLLCHTTSRHSGMEITAGSSFKVKCSYFYISLTTMSSVIKCYFVYSPMATIRTCNIHYAKQQVFLLVSSAGTKW